MSTPPRLAGLTIGATPDAWRRLGFSVDDGGVCRIGAVACRLAGEGRHIRAWSFTGLAGDVTAIDGLPVAAGAGATDYPPAAAHANGVVEIDHLVVATPDLGRTLDGLVAVGLEVRRQRDAGRGMRQVFFRLGGPVILEVVGPAEAAADGPARFFGLAFTVADLTATAAFFGPALGQIKDAVQPGRQIATLHDDSAGTALAFMTAEPR